MDLIVTCSYLLENRGRFFKIKLMLTRAKFKNSAQFFIPEKTFPSVFKLE